MREPSGDGVISIVVIQIHPRLGDSEAVLGLDGLKEGMEARGDKLRASLSSASSRGSQIEVKLPWYTGITCKVQLMSSSRFISKSRSSPK